MIETTDFSPYLSEVAELERTPHGVRPHRLPAAVRAQFPDPQLLAAEAQPSGVRLSFSSDATRVELVLRPTRRGFAGFDRPRGQVVLTVDGGCPRTDVLTGGAAVETDLRTGITTVVEGAPHTATFAGLPAGGKVLELWLPHNEAVELVVLRTDAPIRAVQDDRPLWVHHGSSISQGSNAARPTATWPVVAARAAGVRLRNLGFGGSALLDPFVAREMRDMPADLLSVKVGINVVTLDVMRRRAFTAALHGFLDTIRDGHPTAPLLVVTPIFWAATRTLPAQAPSTPPASARDRFASRPRGRRRHRARQAHAAGRARVGRRGRRPERRRGFAPGRRPHPLRSRRHRRPPPARWPASRPRHPRPHRSTLRPVARPSLRSPRCRLYRSVAASSRMRTQTPRRPDAAATGSGGADVPELLGRRPECDSLTELLRRARAGHSGVLVVRGEAGIGKTALTEYTVETATRTGYRVHPVIGVEAEAQFAFAGLHQLCAPLLGRAAALPEPQREALDVAFGLRDGTTPAPFLVGLAALNLLAEVAEESPLLCLVDDAQWLDQASAQVLAFVARRVAAEPMALLFAVRDTGDGRADPLAGLPELRVAGLGDTDARALLAAAVRAPLAEDVRDRIVAEARGNPLALLELPRGAQLAGGYELPDALSVPHRVEDSFRRRSATLPSETQLLLLVAAAEPTGDVALLWRAADHLGIEHEAAVPAEHAGLLEIGARVRFPHPLVRSAVYRAATSPDQRRVHGALGAATDPSLEPDRRAWHLARAVLGVDEGVAAELEVSAGRARRRGGLSAAAAFLQRAAELTPEPAARASPGAGGGTRQARGRCVRGSLGAHDGRGGGTVGAAAAARLQLLRAQIGFLVSRDSAGSHACCRRRRRSPRWTPCCPATPTCRRSTRPPSPAGSVAVAACVTPPRRPGRHRHHPERPGRWTSCSTASWRCTRRATRRAHPCCSRRWPHTGRTIPTWGTCSPRTSAAGRRRAAGRVRWRLRWSRVGGRAPR